MSVIDVIPLVADIFGVDLIDISVEASFSDAAVFSVDFVDDVVVVA